MMIESDITIRIPSKQITFKNHQGEVLRGNLYLPESDLKKGVVFGHCFTCSRHTRVLTASCEALYRSGIAAFRFDFSGNGQSQGDFFETTYSKHIKEMILAIEQLKHYGVERIGLTGHSMGAAISLLTSSQTADVRAVCTLAGRFSGLDVSHLFGKAKADELKQSGQIRFTSRGRNLVLGAEFFNDVKAHNLAEVVSNSTVPLLAIHGEDDDIIPVSEVYQSRELKPENTTIEVVKDADHMFGLEAHRIQIAELMTDWFEQIL
jgi:putative redox protein